MRPVLAALLLAGPVVAQPLPEVGAVLDAALAEQRAALTCTGLDPSSQALLREQWEVMAEETLAALAAAGYDAEATARFKARAAYDALTPAPGATFDEVAAFCALNPDWRERMQNFQFTSLPGALDGLLAP